MPDYSNGKIYCLRSHQTDNIYIGSTINKLSKRIGGHRDDYKKWLNGKHCYITSFDLVKYDDCYIELIEEYPCENKEQLHKKEGEYIRKMDCVNRCIAGRTNIEWYKDNREKRKEYRQDNKGKLVEYFKQHYQKNREKKLEQVKQYQQENREKILEKKKEKITCECGGVTTKNHLSRHIKSKKHQNFLNN
jgi:hypothetical protein